MIRIVFIGNTVPQAGRLDRMLELDHRIYAVDDLPADRIDVVIGIRFGKDDAKLLQPRLFLVPGAGTDAIDMASLPHDCIVCNAFEHEGPIAEYVFLAMLDREIGYSAMTRDFSSEAWSETYRTRVPHGELAGKVIGLVGAGHIGERIATLAAAFGVRVIAIASKPRAPTGSIEWIGGAERLDEMLTQSDYVVLACPLNDTTRGMIGRAQLDAMKPTAVLINVARGEVANEQELFDALRDQRIGGAVLDSWFRYPVAADETVTPSRFPFDQLPNVRCTPHSSAWTSGVFERRYAVIADNIRRFAAGRPLRNVVRRALDRTEQI